MRVLSLVELKVRDSFIHYGFDKILDSKSDVYKFIKKSTRSKAAYKHFDSVEDIAYSMLGLSKLEDTPTLLSYLEKLVNEDYPISEQEAIYLKANANRLSDIRSHTYSNILKVDKYKMNCLYASKIVTAAGAALKFAIDNNTPQVYQAWKEYYLKEFIIPEDLRGYIMSVFKFKFIDTNVYLEQTNANQQVLILPTPEMLSVPSEDDVLEIFFSHVAMHLYMEYKTPVIPGVSVALKEMILKQGNIFNYSTVEDVYLINELELTRRSYQFVSIQELLSDTIQLGTPVYESKYALIGNINQSITIVYEKGVFTLDTSYYSRVKTLLNNDITFKKGIAFVQDKTLWEFLIGNRQPRDQDFNNIVSCNIA